MNTVQPTDALNTLDAHLHLWDPAVLTYPWLTDEPEMNRSFSLRDVEQVRGEVVSAVFVQVGTVADQEASEVAWVSSLESELIRIVGIVAAAPLEHGDNVLAHLDQLLTFEKVVGVRRLLQNEPADFFERPELEVGLRAVQARELTFDACIRWHQLPELVKLIRKIPGLRVVLDHLGKPPLRKGFNSDEAHKWRNGLDELAQMPNVYLKLSGLAPEAHPLRPYGPQITPFADFAVERFGVERTMIGSDWPISAAAPGGPTYEEWFQFVLQDCLSLSNRERHVLASDTANEFYGLPMIPNRQPDK